MPPRYFSTIAGLTCPDFSTFICILPSCSSTLTYSSSSSSGCHLLVYSLFFTSKPLKRVNVKFKEKGKSNSKNLRCLLFFVFLSFSNKPSNFLTSFTAYFTVEFFSMSCSVFSPPILPASSTVIFPFFSF